MALRLAKGTVPKTTLHPLHHGNIHVHDKPIPHISHTHISIGLAGTAGTARLRSSDEIERKAVSGDEGGGFYERWEVLREGYGEVTAGMEVFESGCHEGDEREMMKPLLI